MTDSLHKGHVFQKIKDCLRGPVDTIARYIREIDNVLLRDVERELTTTTQQKQNSVAYHTATVQTLTDQANAYRHFIDTKTSSMIADVDKHLQQVSALLDKHIDSLESFKHVLQKEKKRYTDTLESGSEVLKHDSGVALQTKPDNLKDIPEHPDVSDLTFLKYEDPDSLILKALGFLDDTNTNLLDNATGITENTSKTSGEDSDESEVYRLTGSADEVLSSTATNIHCTGINNYRLRSMYYSLTPIKNGTAWVIGYNLNGRSLTNDLYQVIVNTDSGKLLCHIQTNNGIRRLSCHPTTGLIFENCKNY